MAAKTAMAAGAPTVESVRLGQGAGKTRIVIDFSGQPDFRAFLLDNPRRLAVDIPAGKWKAAKSGFPDEGAVKAYRSGALNQDGLTRIIFDLTKPAIVDAAFVLPKSAMAKDRVVIDLKPATQKLFSARTSEVWGNKNVKGDGAANLNTAPVSGFAEQRSAGMKKLSPPVPETHGARKGLYTVVVDAGHGGGDEGASSGGLKEKNITLAVAKELKRQLEETGRYRVVLTRDRDYYIKLRERVAIQRRAEGDLFVSIHADKINRRNIQGASIYTLSETASDAETESLADNANTAGIVAGVDLKEESQDVADILLDLAMREKMNESNLLAQMVEQAFRRKNVRLLPNSHRSAGFAVLKAPDVPAILIETGFLSNPEEAKLLSSAVFQQKIAAAMLDGVEAYFRKMQALQKAQ